MSTISPPGPLQDPSRGHLQSSPYSAEPPSLSSSDVSLHRIKNLPGYTTPIFKGKEEQRAKVQDNVAAKVRTSASDVPSRALNFFFFVTLQGFIPRELVANEVQWFYAHLGIDDTYFRNESVEVISDHIIALFGAKVLAYTKHDPSKLVIDLEKIDNEGNGATFIHTSPPGRTSTEGPGSHVEPR
jgi:glutamate dehydrogenase